MKKIFLIIMIFLMAGCSSKKLEPNYEKMTVNKDNINGYVLNLRIYGNYNGKAISENIKVTNYLNKQYLIIKSNNIFKISKTDTAEELKSATYAFPDGVFVPDKDGRYWNTNDVKFTKPHLYLKGLTNITKCNNGKLITINDSKYTEYEVVFNKDIVKTILADTDISYIKVNTDIKGKVYIDNKGYVQRVIYYIDNVTLNANYYDINKVEELNIPTELELRASVDV